MIDSCAVQKELQDSSLSVLQIEDLGILRDFNFVYLKDSIHEEQLHKW